MNSPLGKYGQVVAAIIAVGVVAAFVVGLMFRQLLGLGETDVGSLKELALIALGAVFGAAAAVNGVKGPIEASHRRIDKIETATGIQTHGSYQAGSEGPGAAAEPTPVDMAGPPDTGGRR